MAGSQVLHKLKQLDAYPKINEDFYSRTLSGGVLTIISATIMVLLFFSELRKCSIWGASLVILPRIGLGFVWTGIQFLSPRVHFGGFRPRISTLTLSAMRRPVIYLH